MRRYGRGFALGLAAARPGRQWAGKYESSGHRLATGEEMKALLVIVLVLVIAATAATAAAALSLGHSTVAASVTAVATQAAAASNEPAIMLLSGSALLGLAGALKRLTF